MSRLVEHAQRIQALEQRMDALVQQKLDAVQAGDYDSAAQYENAIRLLAVEMAVIAGALARLVLSEAGITGQSAR